MHAMYMCVLISIWSTWVDSLQTIYVLISTWLMISKGGRWVNWPLLMEDSVGAIFSEYARYVYACHVCLTHPTCIHVPTFNNSCLFCCSKRLQSRL